MAKAAPAPLDANLLGVPKGAAAPAAEVPATPRQQPDPAPAPIPAPAAAQRPAPPPVAPPPAEEPRTALTVRLPVSTQERLREASHRLRQEKQHIVDEALIRWLEERGF